MKPPKSDDKTPVQNPPQPNAWLIRPGALTNPFSVTLTVTPNLASGIAEGDFTALPAEQDGKSVVVVFARIFRLRCGPESTTLYFDALLPVTPPQEVASLGLTPSTSIIERVEWTTFVAALKTATCKEAGDLPILKGQSPAEQTYLRQLLQLAVMDDLLGPANGPFEEVIGMSVRDEISRRRRSLARWLPALSRSERTRRGVQLC
jgi:hypothetical protein